MKWQIFNNILIAWNVFYLVAFFFCLVNAIISVKKQTGKFFMSYALEGLLVVANLAFMYVINEGHIDYGNDKFSGLSALGDWFGFLILTFLVGIPVVVTVVCNVIYVVKKRKQQIG